MANSKKWRMPKKGETVERWVGGIWRREKVTEDHEEGCRGAMENCIYGSGTYLTNWRFLDDVPPPVSPQPEIGITLNDLKSVRKAAARKERAAIVLDGRERILDCRIAGGEWDLVADQLEAYVDAIEARK